jgi:hypothetical protein
VRDFIHDARIRQDRQKNAPASIIERSFFQHGAKER